MEGSIIPYIIAVILAIIGTVLIFKKAKSDTKKVMVIFGIVLFALGAFVFSWQYGWLVSAGISPIGKIAIPYTNYSLSVAGNNQPVITPLTACPVQETGTYSGKDKFATTSISGTSYYKTGSNTATTTAAASLNKNTVYSYWLQNGTYYTAPVTKTAACGVNTFQADAYSNGSATITGYDTVGHASISNGASNISMGANDNAKVELTYIGSAKTSAMPFGGVMVIEYNNTMPTVGCSGDGILGLNSKYQITYAPVRGATNAYHVYEVASGFDVSADGGTTGVTKTIRCDLTNGATAVGNDGYWYVKFIPANWYLGNDGNFYLDTEQKMNGATTRTGYGFPSATFGWSA